MQKIKMRKSYKRIWLEAKKIIPGGNSLLSKDLKDFYRMVGLRITLKLKELIFGHWIIKN